MAIPTVEQAINEAAFLLGDIPKRRFTQAELAVAVGMGWREMIDEMHKCQDAEVELQALYTLPAGTLTLTPATAGISNFGSLVRLEERPAGSATSAYFKVSYAEVLPIPWSPTNRVIYYTWRAGTFSFPQTSADVELRITYFHSGDVPATGSLGLDNCLTVVSKLAVSLIGRTKGVNDIPAQCRNEVYVFPNHMQALIQPHLRMQQERRVQPAAYSVGSNRRRPRGFYPNFGP